MTISAFQQNNIPIDVELNDLFDLKNKSLLLNLNCHHIGTVQSFNSSNQTATVTINYLKTFFKLNEVTNTYDPYTQEYPVLVDCPVVCLGGGNSSLTFPITAGDECLVFFNDRDLDNWLTSGSGYEVNTSRLHSFSDAIVLVGVRSFKNSLANYDTNRAIIKASTGGVGVNKGNGKVYIANDGSTLGGALIAFANSVAGAVGDADAKLATIQAAASTLSSAIGGILE